MSEKIKISITLDEWDSELLRQVLDLPLKWPNGAELGQLGPELRNWAR